MDVQGTVLVVEDDPDIADTYAAHLDGGWRVRVATTGKTAIETFDSDVDIVLLDRGLSDVSGDVVLGELCDRSVECQIALVTAREPDIDVLELGFDEYLVKPVDGDDLRDVVFRLDRRREYTETTQALYAALRKRELLRERHPESDLRERAEYTTLLETIEDLRARTKRLGDDLQHGDFRALFFDLARSQSGQPTYPMDA